VLHWINALAALWLTWSGALIYFDQPHLMGMDQPSLRFWHYCSGFVLAVAPVLSLLWATHDQGWRSELRMLLWDWHRDDWRWLGAVARVLILGEAYPPPVGRYNAGQKLNARAVALLAAGLFVTGVLMANGGLVPAILRAGAYQVHDWLAVALLPIVAGHLVLTTLWPPTRQSLPGMIDGRVDATWLARQHPLSTAPPSPRARDRG
jgi:formate dehydrogenase subunit gamma